MQLYEIFLLPVAIVIEITVAGKCDQRPATDTKGIKNLGCSICPYAG